MRKALSGGNSELLLAACSSEEGARGRGARAATVERETDADAAALIPVRETVTVPLQAGGSTPPKAEYTQDSALPCWSARDGSHGRSSQPCAGCAVATTVLSCYSSPHQRPCYRLIRTRSLRLPQSVVPAARTSTVGALSIRRQRYASRPKLLKLEEGHCQRKEKSESRPALATSYIAAAACC